MLTKFPLNIAYVQIVIFFSFFLSLILSTYYLKNYDKYPDLENSNHLMIKSDSYRYLSHGAEIKKDLDDGKKFFETGREHFTKYLPPRLAAAYYYLLDIDLFNNFDEKKINIGIHFPYLLIQSLIYYLSLIFLYSAILIKIEKKICLPIIVFLCIEPTIFQYHGTFWSESIFFSLQIIVLTLILKNKINVFNFFILGVFISLLSLQRQTAYFFIIPIIFYYLIFIKKNEYYKLIFLFIGFFTIQSIVGYNNLIRDNKFYLLSGDSKTAIYYNIGQQLVSEGNDLTREEFRNFDSKMAQNWLQKNSIKFDTKNVANKIENTRLPFTVYRKSIVNESDKVLFDNFYAKKTIEILLNRPWLSFKIILKNSMHSALLNPFHIYSDHNFVDSEYYYLTETHDKLIPIRIFYSILIYTISLLGFFTLVMKKEYKLLSILMLSMIYSYGMISWHGNTRYFVPVLIYLSFFFGYGCNNLLLSLKKFKK